jgi:hypothetical protein
LYFLGLLVPTLFLHSAPGWAWASYLLLSSACAAGSLALLSCPSCSGRLPNFGVERCPRCDVGLQAPIAVTLCAVRRWRWTARALILGVGVFAVATLVGAARGAMPPNVVFAGVLAAGGLLVAARHPLQRGQVCPKCRGRLQQPLWRPLRRCGTCSSAVDCLKEAGGGCSGGCG